MHYKNASDALRAVDLCHLASKLMADGDTLATFNEWAIDVDLPVHFFDAFLRTGEEVGVGWEWKEFVAEPREDVADANM